MATTKFVLTESQMPTRWYNIQADMKELPPPPLHPGTKQPVGPQDLGVILPMALILQEVSRERWIEIPEEIQSILKLWRPSPLYRAHRLEKALDTPAHIYYKYEGNSPVGSHKPNTAVAQAYYNKQEGVKRLTTETGAGQWGSALSMACQFFGLDLTVYMVKVSYHQKPYRRVIMESYGAKVHASPTDTTEAGRRILAENPNSPGSLGIAISEAVEVAVQDSDARYSLGSVLNHVLMHQTIIGLEARQQMEMAGEYPDVVIGCHGGGSNFAGLSFPFLMDKLQGARPALQLIAAEPASCPTLTRGVWAYDYGDTAGMAPIAAMYTLGHSFVPPGIHAGGLRYHGAAPLVSQLLKDGYIKAQAFHQTPCFDAALKFARTEGIVPAPESSHAVRSAIDAALAAREAGEQKVILFNLSGHGLFDLGAYESYLAGKLEDVSYPEEALQEALALLPQV